MKYILTAVMAFSLLNSVAVMADPDHSNRNDQSDSRDDRGHKDRDHGDRDHGDKNHGERDRGDRGHDNYRDNYARDDHDRYRDNHDRYRYDDQGYYRDHRDDHDQRWRHRYSRTYTYNDDNYYRECRNSPDPAGVIAGAVIGGLLGNAAGHGRDRGGATIAGVIAGGAVGAALTSHLDCEDRSYAYRTYYDGFNAGRPNTVYRWDNPRNNHRGEFRVNNYYNDPDGFRCSNYSQITYIQGRRRTIRGKACRQPDGVWAIVD